MEAATEFVRERYGQEDADAFASVAAGRHGYGHWVWGGIVHDLFALTLFIVLQISGLKFIGAKRALRRVRRGRCVRCRYDVIDLGDSVCPECGTPIVNASA